MSLSFSSLQSISSDQINANHCELSLSCIIGKATISIVYFQYCLSSPTVLGLISTV